MQKSLPRASVRMPVCLFSPTANLNQIQVGSIMEPCILNFFFENTLPPFGYKHNYFCRSSLTGSIPAFSLFFSLPAYFSKVKLLNTDGITDPNMTNCVFQCFKGYESK